MKIDFTQMIYDLDDKTPMRLHTGFDAEREPVFEDASLKRTVVLALWNPLRGDDGLTVDQKIKLDELARLIHKNDIVDLAAEDIALIKDRVNKAYQSVGIVAGARRLLDPPAPRVVESA